MKRVALPAPVKAQGTLSEYYDRLKADGWKNTGSGMGGVVYTKGNLALKVSCDEAYDHFLEYALAYQNNPWFPKIYSVQRFEEVFDNPFDRQRNSTKPDWWDRSWGEWSPGHGQTYTVTVMEKLEFKKNSYHKRKRVSGTMEQMAKQINWDMNPPMKKMSRSQRQATKVLAELFETHMADLHDRNIMYRGNQLVIIDPVWN